jgi:hypothetical protein
LAGGVKQLRNTLLNSVGATFYGRLLKGRFPHLGVHRGTPLHNSKGISVLFLVIAMLLMVTIGYVFSYLIPAKQRSVSFPIYSNQAFFIAQSGVEYAVRYSADQGWTSTASLLGLNAPGVNQRNLGNGSFSISYNNLTDMLTSIGQIPNVGERRIVVSNFTTFVSTGLVLVTPVPCWVNPRTVARFYIKNVGSSSITLTSFSASCSQPPVRTLTSILMDGVQKFGGTYSSGSGVSNFTPPGTTQIVYPNQTIMVNLTWNQNISPNCSVIVSFFDSSGKEYTFNLDPEGDGFPNC